MLAHQRAVAWQVPSFERAVTHKVDDYRGTCDGATYTPPTCVPLECKDHSEYDCPETANGVTCSVQRTGSHLGGEWSECRATRQ